MIHPNEAKAKNMIVRAYLKCGECEQPHIVRIGMGQETSQRHHFACRSCHEAIEVGLDVDYENISYEVIFGTNAVAIAPIADAPIVNVDANFLIPEDEQGQEMAFPRLQQGAAIVQKMIEERRARGLPDLPEPEEELRSGRPDFAAEWKECRAAWSLWRNGKDQLVQKRVASAPLAFNYREKFSGLPDWLFQFSTKLGGPRFQKIFEDCFDALAEAKTNNDFRRLASTYHDQLSKAHGRMFFDLFKSYFAAFDEFAQVQFLITSGAKLPDAKAASSQFDAVKMFYGNAFETLSSVAEFPAYINNLLLGRKFDEFASMDRDQYVRLDKAGRFRCFEENPLLSQLSEESDNVLRNASHHGGLDFDPKSHMITYRAGKGGQGDEETLDYTDYLIRCVNIFMQSVVIFRVQLVLSNGANLRPPL